MLGEKMAEIPIVIRDAKRTHRPIVIVVDTSEAMNGPPIDAINQSLSYFKEKCKELETDEVVDICIIAFGGKGPNGVEPDIQVLQPFTPANKMSYDTLTNPLIAKGITPMAHALDTCLKEISKITLIYKNNQINLAAIPQVLILVKGIPTEDIDYSNNVKSKFKKAVDNRNIWTQNFGIGKWYELGWFRDFFGDKNSFALGDINDAEQYIGIFNSLVKYICGQNTADIEGDTDYNTTEDLPSYNFIEPKRLHHPIVILVDKSEAMNGPPIDAINQSLFYFKEMCKKLGKEEGFVVDICIIAFGGKGLNGVEPDIQILQSFTTPNKMSYDTLNNPLIARGVTPMAHALDRCLKEIKRITNAYTKNNIDYKQPLLITLVRGKPTDDEEIYDSVHKSIKKLVDNKFLWTQSIGIGNVSEFMWLGDFFGVDKSKVLSKIENIEAYTGFFDTLVNYMSSIEIPISVDIVYCIDATGKRNNPHLEIIKNIAKNLHKIIAYRLDKKEYHGQRVIIDSLRVKVIVFRDLSSGKDDAIKQTRFFNVLYNTESAEYERSIDEIKSGDESEEHNSALEALHLAINSAWVGENVTDNRRRHVIVLCTESSTYRLDDVRYRRKASNNNPRYPTDAPQNLAGLFQEWCNMDELAKRLIIFAPNDDLWHEIGNIFTPCLSSSVELDDESLDQMLEFILF